MSRIAALGLGLLLLLAPRGAAASQPVFEGTSSVSLTAALMDSVRLGAEARLRIIAYGNSGESLDVKVRLPRGLERVSGDTVAAIARGRTGTWILALRATEAGTHEIRFEAIGHRKDGIDETDCSMTVNVNASTPGASSHTHRQERVVGGRRYRCGDLYLVPIDHREDFTESAIRTAGAKPVAAPGASARDTTLDRAADVRVVVIVGADGKPIEARPAWSTAPDAPGLAAALSAVKRWHFKPATMRGRPINDWVELTVRVEPGPG